MRAATRHALDLGKAGAIMREAGFALDDTDPVTAWADREADGHFRQLRADYASGWRVTLKRYRDGTQSLGFEIRMRAKVEGRGA